MLNLGAAGAQSEDIALTLARFVPQLQPDLIIYGPAAFPYVDVLTAADGNCAVVEGLIAGGTHKLVRFSTESRNIGAAAPWSSHAIWVATNRSALWIRRTDASLS